MFLVYLVLLGALVGQGQEAQSCVACSESMPTKMPLVIALASAPPSEHPTVRFPWTRPSVVSRVMLIKLPLRFLWMFVSQNSEEKQLSTFK